MEKRDTSDTPSAGSMAQGQWEGGLAGFSWQKGQRKYCVTALIRKLNAASFIHGYIGYLAHFGLVQLQALQYFRNTVPKIFL